MVYNPFTKTKTIVSSSGKLVGYDTGTQSVQATPTQKATYELTRRLGGGGGVNVVTQEEYSKQLQEESKRQQELQQKLSQEKAIQLQNQQAQARAQEVQQRREYIQKLQRMSAQQRQAYFIQQNQTGRAYALQQLRQQGKRLTPQAQREVNLALEQQRKSEMLNLLNQGRENYIKSQQSVDLKYPITKKIESVLFKTGILNEKKYREWEKGALKKADKFEKTNTGQFLKRRMEDLRVTSQDLFVNLPTAVLNLLIGASKLAYKTAKNPKPLIKYSSEQLNTISKIIAKEIKKNNNPKKVLNRIVKLYLLKQATDKNVSKQKKKLLLNTARFTVNKYGSVKSLINDFKNLTPSQRLQKVKKVPYIASAFIAGASTSFVRRSYENLQRLPGSLTELVNNPRNIKNIPKGIKTDIVDTISLLRTNPSEGIGKIGSDIFTYKFINGSLKFTGKVTSKVATRLDPYFKKFEGNTLKLSVPKETFVRRGKETFLKSRVIKPSIKTPSSIIDYLKGKKPGQFKKFQETKGITLKQGLLTDSATSLRNQAKLAGKKGTIVTAQANRLVNFIKRNKVIRKPISGEERLSIKAKNLLKKFDGGRISNSEFYRLNKLMLKEIGKTPLERSLYATPDGVIRFTRLGGEVAEASWRDILRGNFSFRNVKMKPQVIVFPEGKISKFPKSIRDVVNKLKAGKIISESERARLIKWQVKPTGKWKPIGDVRYRGGIELETTLAPGEVIRRVKKLATVKINKVPVDIVQAKVIKLSKSTKNLLNKAKKGRISSKQIGKLKKALSKETNLPIKGSDIRNLSRKFSSRRATISRPYLPIRRLATARGLRALGKRGRYTLKRTRISGRIKSPTSRFPSSPRGRMQRIPIGKTPRVTIKRTPRFIPKYIKQRPPIRPPRVPGKTIPPSKPPVKKIRFSRSQLKRYKKQKIQPSFNVFGKSGKKFVRLNKLPLTKLDALSRGSFAIDRTTSAQFKIVPARKVKKLGKLRSEEKNYFARSGYKLREFRIKKGRAFKIKPKYIEKTRFRIDTSGEKKGLSIAKFLKQKYRTPTRRIINRTPKRAITPSRRKFLLKNLVKARRVRMSNLRRRR